MDTSFLDGIFNPLAEPIERFTGEYKFLSNSYPEPVKYKDYTYPTVDHAYQAAKFENPTEAEGLSQYSVKEAIKFGYKTKLPEDWEWTKVQVMRELVLQKFEQNPILMEKLLKTKDKEIIFGNLWHDNVWGSCDCPSCRTQKGSNLLGHILMSIRKEHENDI